jgi:hypothetical protein
MRDAFLGASLVIAALALFCSFGALAGSGKGRDAPISVTDQAFAAGLDAKLADYSAALTVLRQENKKLQGAIERLQTDIEKQREEFDGFRQAFWRMRNSGFLSGKSKAVVLDPSLQTYGRVDTENGFLFVACEDVVSFLDGYKVKLRVGNPLLARYSGFKITVRWGRRYNGPDNDVASYGEWHSRLKNREFSYPQELAPGRWNLVEITLPQTDASEVGHIEAGIETDILSLGLPQ